MIWMAPPLSSRRPAAADFLGWISAQLRQQLFDGNRGQRFYNEIGQIEIAEPRQSVRHGDAEQARLLCRRDTMGGILECDRLFRPQPQSCQRGEVEFRVWLGLFDIVPAKHGIERSSQSKRG